MRWIFNILLLVLLCTTFTETARIHIKKKNVATTAESIAQHKSQITVENKLEATEADDDISELIDQIESNSYNDTALDHIDFATDGNQTQAVQDLCTRVHNNTAFAGVVPYSTKTVKNAFECQRTCVEEFPLCVAVVFYFVHDKKNEHLCYYFDKNSVDDHVQLMAEAPKHKKDIVRALEIVVNCRQFDPVPPPSDQVISSSDKVDRTKRQHTFQEPIKSSGPWTSWSGCTPSGSQVRSQVCEYGRNIQRRGCAARDFAASQQQQAQYDQAAQYQQQQAQRQAQEAAQRAAPTVQYRPAEQRPQPSQAQYPPTPYNHQDYYRANPTQAPIQPSDEERQRAQEYEKRRQQYEEQMRVYNQQQQDNQRAQQAAQRQEQPHSQAPFAHAIERHPAIPSADPCPGDVCVTPRPDPRQLGRTEERRILPTLPTYPSASFPTRPPPPPTPPCFSNACQPAKSSFAGSWSGWSDFSGCSCTCGEGIKQRRRICEGGAFCIGGTDVETERCNMGPCETWSPWCDWSACSSSCGVGEKSRTRFCLQGTNRCEGKDFEAQQCDAGPCPEWSSWTDFSACSTSCGNGFITRTRTCMGGDTCQGRSSEEQYCDNGPCSTWSPWTDFSACSASCGDGVKRRSRTCIGGTDCQGESEESLFCTGPPCANWSEWDQWSLCSVDCGPGRKTRTRVCQLSNGSPSEDCLGNNEEVTLCNERECCSWTEWCDFSTCDKECGGGQRSRSRICQRPGIGFDDTCTCPGQDTEFSQCNEYPCAPQCGWTEWCPWSPCNVLSACESGQSQRSRQCVGEVGCSCEGTSMDRKQCQGLIPCTPPPQYAAPC
uniref:Apple domain-containing protein n=1 Tax=Rhabditophanes sp. KR3021 TaxID=114890 RepID=A0AC35UAR7_9BILA